MEPKTDALVIKISGDSVQETPDVVASELPITIVLNGEPLVTLLCTPIELKELAVGFLVSEGMLSSASSIQKIEVGERETSVRIDISGLPADWNEKSKRRTLTSGCGKGVTFTDYRSGGKGRIDVKGLMIARDDVKRLLETFRNLSRLYVETGGVHSAALSDGKDIILFSEDIGRHNAVDKLIGKAFLQSLPLGNKILITSGRVTSEIMMKTVSSRIPVLISRTAPSCIAINLAEESGVTLIGFARGDRMNIYSWPNRIVF